jgi:hypothetical protein
MNQRIFMKDGNKKLVGSLKLAPFAVALTPAGDFIILFKS